MLGKMGKLRKILSLLLSFGLLFQQISFAQIAAELNIANYLSRIGSNLTQERFRPLHLRYFSYDTLKDSFKLLLDKGDLKNLGEQELESSTKTLLNYFLVGVTLPGNAFWVNLRPDSEDQIIDPYLEKTDVGKIMLEADLQLKKDTAKFTSPETPEGREYWNKLYKKAEGLFGYDSVTIPTLTRPWIVPGEIIVREGNDNAYIYKATLKVMLEQDYLRDSAAYNFEDVRSKVLNEYSSQLIRELIIPKLTKEVNSSKRYASLRQVYYSLILSRWFKLRFAGKSGTYASLIDTRNLTDLTPKEPWSKTDYFKQYQKSFKDGEYNIKEPVYTPTGQVIRSYFSGGIEMGATASSSINNRSGIVNPTELSPENLSKLGVLMKGNPVGMQLSAASPLADKNPSRELPKYGDSNFWPGRMKMQMQDLGNLELVSVSMFFGRPHLGDWLFKNVFPIFEKAEPEVQRILQRKLSNPARTHKEVLKERQTLAAMLELAEVKGGEEEEPLLERLMKLIKSYQKTKNDFYYELQILRSYHYPYFSLYAKRPIDTPAKYNKPYPDVVPSLIKLGKIILTLQEIERTIPDHDSPIIKKWKGKIQEVLARKELRPFLERPHFLEAITDWRIGPYVFVKPDDLKSFMKSKDSRYLRDHENFSLEYAVAAQKHLREGKKLGVVLKEASTLAEELTDLWVINVDTLSEEEHQRFVKAAEEEREEEERRMFDAPFDFMSDRLSGLFGDRHKSRKLGVKASGDKHPFLRQFPDGMIQDPLAEMDYYARIARYMYDNNYHFADIHQPTGTINLTLFRSPVLIAGNFQRVTGRSEPTDLISLLSKITGDTRGDEEIEKKIIRIEPISVKLSSANNALLLSGPNMGGKTTTARDIGLAVLLNQVGLPIPDEFAQLGIFRNIYTVFPQPEQLQAGYGYFANLIKQLTELIKKAGPGDLIILDEVPTGTDYYGLVAISTVLIEDLINSGATVIVTGHLKKAFELIAERTGQQPFMHTVKEEGDHIVPDYRLEPGIAKHSYAIELMSQVDFPNEIVELARSYYLAITEGKKLEDIKRKDRLPYTDSREEEQSSGFNMFETILRNLYPEKHFAFEKKSQDNLISIFTAQRKEAESMQALFRGMGGFFGMGDEARKEVEIEKGKDEEKDDVAERLRITDLFISQKAEYLEKLTDMLSAFREIPSRRGYWGKPKYEHDENMQKLQYVKKALEDLLKHVEVLEKDKEIKSVLEAFRKALEQLDTLQKESTEKYNPEIGEDGLVKLEQEWKGKWNKILDSLANSLLILDEYTGIARSVLKYELKAPEFSDKPNTFSLKKSRPLFPNRGFLGEGEPFLKNGVPQSFTIDSEKPVMVLTGPNSSGKSVLMLNSYVNALFAHNGFYVSGDLETSRFEDVHAFFGGRNVTDVGESYFLNILKQYAKIIDNISPNSIVVLDELHGTDNFELAAIQLAVLHYLREKNVTVIFNTHIRDGLKLAAEKVGLDFWQTDVEYNALENKVMSYNTCKSNLEKIMV